MRRILGSAWLGLALLVACPAASAAQAEGTRPWLDYFMSRYHAAAAAEGQQEGVGGRLMWATVPVLGRGYGSWLDRSAVGAYLVHTPETTDGAEEWRYGVQADLSLAPRPRAARLEPLASVSFGALRLQEPGIPRALPVPPAVASTAPPPETFLSLAPGLGVRIRVLPGIAFRGDARQVIDFREGMRRNFELSGGLTVGS